MLSVCLSAGKGGREAPEKSGLEIFDEEGRDLCAGQGNMGWTLKFLYIIKCGEKKQYQKVKSLNFCSFFLILLLLFLYLGAGGCCLFL